MFPMRINLMSTFYLTECPEFGRWDPEHLPRAVHDKVGVAEVLRLPGVGAVVQLYVRPPDLLATKVDLLHPYTHRFIDPLSSSNEVRGAA